MATIHTETTHTTPQTQADIRELAEMLIEKKITPEEYFAAVDRRALRLVADEAVGKR